MSESVNKIDVKNRTFLLNENINAKSVEEVVLGIHEINRLDDKDSENKVEFTRKPIKLVLDTYGGGNIHRNGFS
ncbi:hypothetical protein [Sporosarcina sp. FSL W7-1283]|uniref:hypothetical protein n=1 Tax=Sporosarcina sp. FSL W7-1283 TaxID=2921560 RepID=UPI0030F90006